MRISDWSSDVCSSDLVQRNSSGSSRVRSWTMYHPGSVGRSVRAGICRPLMAVAASESVISCPLYFGMYGPVRAACLNLPPAARKSVVQGQIVSGGVDLGGRRIIQKKCHTREGGPRKKNNKIK